MAFALLGEEEANEELQNEVPNLIVEELEKVKAEIEYLTNYCSFDVYGKKYPVYDKTEVLQILDKHISELKGE